MRSIVVLAFLAGCSSAGEAHKVALLSTGVMEPAADSRLLRDIEDELELLGFEVSHDPNALEAMDEDAARTRAGRIGASHALVIEFDTHTEREGALPGSHLYAGRVTAHVVNEYPQHPKTKPYSLEFVQEDTSITALASSARKVWVNALAPHAADAMAYSPQLSTLLDGEGDAKALYAVNDLKKFEYGIDERHDAALEYEAFCQAEGERLHSFADAEGLTCYGNPCGQYAMVGVDPNNRPIVQDLSRNPVFKVPVARKGYWAEPPERLVVLEENGVERDLMRSGNYYGIATVRDGDVGTVEAFTSEGSSVVWGFSTKDGSRKQVTLLAPRERNSISEVSPHGEMTFWCIKDSGQCFVQGTGEKTDLPSLAWARWSSLDSGLRIVGDLREGGLVVLDPESPDTAKPIQVGGRMREVLGAVGDEISLIVRDERRECSLVRIDGVFQRVTETIPMPTCIESAKMVPDGRIVGTAYVTHPDDVPGDAEVVVWQPGQKAPFQLTSGSFHEEIVYPARDGSKLFFNRRLEAPSDTRFDTQVYRRAVCEVELPPR